MYDRVGEGEERYLSKNLFKRELRNGECVKRIILILYSPSQGCLYCFPCRLLSKKQSAFATSGFNYWKYSNLTVDHENGVEHLKCMTAYLVRQKEAACVDSLLAKNRRSEQEYWHKEFTRVVINCHSHSCLQRFAISCSESNYWSAKNGNFFGILELLSEFDPFGGIGPYCVTILYNCYISIFVFFSRFV